MQKEQRGVKVAEPHLGGVGAVVHEQNLKVLGSGIAEPSRQVGRRGDVRLGEVAALQCKTSLMPRKKTQSAVPPPPTPPPIGISPQRCGSGTS